MRQTTAYSVNTFENPNGAHVGQVFAGGMPITRELEPAAALAAGWDAFKRAYPGCTLAEWNATDGARELARK